MNHHNLNTFIIIVVAFALLLGVVNVVNVHWGHIQARKSNSIYSKTLWMAISKFKRSILHEFYHVLDLSSNYLPFFDFNSF